MSPTNAFLISLAIAFAGFIPFFIAVYRTRRIKKLRETGAISTGTVQEMYERWSSKGGKYYYVTINFPLPNGSVQQVNYHFSSKGYIAFLAKGNTVTIIYNPDKPKRFLIKEIPDSKALYIVTLVLALIYIVIAFFLYNTIVQ